jgi:hypothetical protein
MLKGAVAPLTPAAPVIEAIVTNMATRSQALQKFAGLSLRGIRIRIADLSFWMGLDWCKSADRSLRIAPRPVYGPATLGVSAARASPDIGGASQGGEADDE